MMFGALVVLTLIFVVIDLAVALDLAASRDRERMR